MIAKYINFVRWVARGHMRAIKIMDISTFDATRLNFGPTNNKTGQTVQLFMNMTVSEYSQEAAAAIAKCDDYIHHGWAPNADQKHDLDTLVSGLRHADDIEGGMGCFEPVEGLDADVQVGSEWVFVPHEFDTSSAEEEESVDKESVDGE